MPEIAYLMSPAGAASAFMDEAADHYAARSDVTVVDTATSLDGVLADLRSRATGGQIFPVVTLVCPDADPLALPFPVSDSRRGVDSGRITTATLQAAVRNAGAPGYPAVLGAPAVTEDTAVWIHGPDVGHDVAFVTRLAQLFGPSLTIYAPLVPEVIGGDLTRYRRTVLSGERAPSTHVLDVVAEPTPVEEPMSQLFGKYRARVVDVADPTSQGRLNVTVPATGRPDETMWAVACLPPLPAGLVRTPTIGSDVWVEFEGGDPSMPIWTGVTWGTSYEPADLTIENDGDLTLRAGQKLLVESGAACDVSVGGVLDIRSATVVTVEAGVKVDVSSAGQLTLQAAILTVESSAATFTGTVNAPTLVASSGIVSPSYTPGAGNIW